MSGLEDSAATAAVRSDFGSPPEVAQVQERGPRLSPRITLVMFLIAIVLYLPGIWWGLPHATGPDRTRPWGSDELAALGPIAELYSVFLGHARFNPQYPLFQYIAQAVLVGPYLIWLSLTGRLGHPGPEFPYGFADPQRALATMTILARIVSLLMAAGVVVITSRVAAVLWDRRTGLIAALVVLFLYPMFFYSRTSNVDMGALFWTAAGFWVVAIAFRDGLSVRRAAVLGALAALAAATKDAAAFAFLAAAIVLVPRHLLDTRAQSWLVRLKPLFTGLVSALAVYAIASGLVFSPARFRAHVAWMTGTSMSMEYPATLGGNIGLLRETTSQIVSSLGFPIAVLALLGLLFAIWRDRRALWLALVAVVTVVGTILPIHFVMLRYVLIPAYALSFFAAYALSMLLASTNQTKRKMAGVFLVVAIAWSGVRAADLTYQMVADGRYALAAWLRQAARPGDRVAFFGATQKLPALDASVVTVPEQLLCSPADWSRESPDFVLVIPQQHFEIVHEISLHEDTYHSLNDGSLGYAKVGRMQRRGLTSRLAIPWVNPPMEIYARRDRLAGLPAIPKNLEQPALFAPLEAKLNLQPKIPAGLARNLKARSVETCQSRAAVRPPSS